MPGGVDEEEASSSSSFTLDMITATTTSTTDADAADAGIKPSLPFIMYAVLLSILAATTMVLGLWHLCRSRSRRLHHLRIMASIVPLTMKSAITLHLFALAQCGLACLMWVLVTIAAVWLKERWCWEPVVWAWYGVYVIACGMQLRRISAFRRAKSCGPRVDVPGGDDETATLLGHDAEVPSSPCSSRIVPEDQGDEHSSGKKRVYWRFLAEIAWTPILDVILQTTLLVTLWLPAIADAVHNHRRAGTGNPPFDTDTRSSMAVWILFVLFCLCLLTGLLQVSYLIAQTPPQVISGISRLIQRWVLALRNIPAHLVRFRRRLKLVSGYCWPSDRRDLQLLILVSYAVLALGRILNAFAPIQAGRVIDALGAYVTEHVQKPSQNVLPGPDAGVSNQDDAPIDGSDTADDEAAAAAARADIWTCIALYLILRIFQGGMGLLSSLRSFLWNPIRLYLERRLRLLAFSHLHHLSFAYHTTRKTGEIIRIMDRGTDSLVELHNTVVFSIFPILADMIVAIVLVAHRFDASLAGIISLTLVLYCSATILITRWRAKFRRDLIESYNKTGRIEVDSLLNFEAVKYYNNEEHEVARLASATASQMKAEWKSLTSLALLNTTQNLIMTAVGLLMGILLIASRVMDGTLTVGDYVTFLAYMAQLNGPLNVLGSMYRSIQADLIDMEEMLALLEKQPTVTDLPDAPPLTITDGAVEFRNVCFSYDDRRPILKGVNFTVPKGSTVALVGRTGAGKSTVIKLLFRLFDVESGQILIDGQDLRHVTQDSIRRNIGVVPQETALFDESVGYNIAYPRPDAPQAAIEHAAKMAQIHERILEFPDRYKSLVGERGLRLSGGEKQRIAIARNFLKDPAIILLDEATSALDTATEQQIQHALHSVTQRRTSIVVAHRLSTIVHADQILVFEKGTITERGSHQELLAKCGVYHRLWHRQIEGLSIDDMDEALEGNEKPRTAANGHA